MALTLKKIMNNCIIVLKLPKNEAGSILSAEFTRIAYDERNSENKGVIIQVNDDNQKMVAERLAQVYMENAKKTKLCQTGRGKVKVRVGNDLSEPEDSANVINLGEFDYEKEKQKLLARYNDTIISNSKIKDDLIEGTPPTRKTDTQRYQKDISELESKIQQLSNKIVNYQFGFLSIFRGRQIRNCQDEIDDLKEELEAVQEKQDQYNKIKQKEYKERKRRIEGLMEKEDNMKGIKFMFTGKRESLVKNVYPDNKVSYEFVLDRVQPDYILPEFRQLINPDNPNNLEDSKRSEDGYEDK
jgi:hypothetical protein